MYMSAHLFVCIHVCLYVCVVCVSGHVLVFAIYVYYYNLLENVLISSGIVDQ